MRRGALVGIGLVLFGLIACERTAGPDIAAPEPATTDGRVVARVANRVILEDDVRQRMALDDLDARDAIDSLVAEALLARAAEKAAIAPDPEGLRKADRVMVRAFLRDIEGDHRPQDVSPEEVRADFEQHHASYQILERRAPTHLLAKSESEAARAKVVAALAEARRADDPVAALKQFADADPADDGIDVVVEELPAITRKASIEKPFLDALFDAESTGPLKNPIQTRYGWHALVVADIQPAETRTLRDVEDDIRERLSDQARFEALVALVRSLETEGLVQYDQSAVNRLLEAPEVPRREP